MCYRLEERYCQVLEICEGATLAEVREAFKRMALRYHPDKNKSPDAAQLFREIKEAHDYLVDKREREQQGQSRRKKAKQWDSYGAQFEEDIFSPPDMSEDSFDLSREFSPPSYWGRTPRNRRRRPQGPPQDPPVYHKVALTLEEILSGCTKKMKITRTETFVIRASRQSTVLVTLVIEPGVVAGKKYVFARYGDRKPGVVPADVVFVVEEKPHQVFKRSPNKVDLVYTHKVSFVDAVTCAVHLSLHGLDGREIDTWLDEVITPATEYRIEQAGLPRSNSPAGGRPRYRGDLVIRFQIVYPPRLNLERRLELARLWLQDARK